jgi:hypothetical protein
MSDPLYCDCCRKDREVKRQEPRPLLVFGVGKKGGDLYLCEYCDGEEIVSLITKNEEDPLL